MDRSRYDADTTPPLELFHPNRAITRESVRRVAIRRRWGPPFSAVGRNGILQARFALTPSISVSTCRYNHQIAGVSEAFVIVAIQPCASRQLQGLADPSELPAPELRWVPILVNRVAGARHRADLVDELVRRLKARSLRPEVFSDRDAFRGAVTDPEHIRECRCQVAAGGDGTLSWVVNSQRQSPVALFPLGSENLLARHLGIRRDAAAVEQTICDFRRRTIDLGRANGLYFSLIASAGFDSAVVRRLHASRLGNITRWDYVRAIAHCLARFDYPEMAVQADDEPEEFTGRHVFVFNSREYAMRIPICPTAVVDDRLLDLVVLRRPGKLNVLRYLCTIFTGRHYRLPDVVCRKVRKLRIRGAGLPLECDGDPAGELPVDIEVVPASLTVLVPG